MAKKQSNSKVLQMVISSLDENRNERMLSWTTREKGEFKIIFVHKSSPNWDTGFISLFEDVDKISEKKYMKYQKKKEYESDCKFRFKSNLIKLQKCGALKSLRERDKKINKSIQEKHYRILKDFSGKSALKPKMKINENINMDTFTEEESVRRNNEVSALMIADTISNKISGGSEKNEPLVNTEYTGIENAYNGESVLKEQGIQLFSKDIENESLVSTENSIMEDIYIGKKQGIQQFSKDIENESFVNTENAITGSTHSDEDVCKEQEILKNFKDIENKIVKTVSVFDKFCNDVPKITELAALKVDNGQLVKPSLACNPCDTMQQTKPGNEVFATPANYFLPFLCHDLPEQFPQDYENTFHYSPENNDSRMESHLNYPLDCMDFMKGELSLDIKDMLHDEGMDSSNVFSNMKGSRDPFLSSSFSWGTNETMDFEFPEAEILQHLMDEKQFKLEDLQFFN